MCHRNISLRYSSGDGPSLLEEETSMRRGRELKHTCERALLISHSLSSSLSSKSAQSGETTTAKTAPLTQRPGTVANFRFLTLQNCEMHVVVAVHVECGKIESGVFSIPMMMNKCVYPAWNGKYRHTECNISYSNPNIPYQRNRSSYVSQSSPAT